MKPWTIWFVFVGGACLVSYAQHSNEAIGLYNLATFYLSGIMAAFHQRRPREGRDQ